MKATINVPTSLDEITLKQYQKYLAEQKINEDEYNLQLKAIEIFCNVPENSVKKIIAKDVRKITEKIAELFNSEPPLLKSFKMQGVEYGFIPNLDEITFGEYIDLDTYIPQWENMHLAMNVLYRPIAHRSSGRYELVPYSTITPEKSLGAPMSAVLGSLFFFIQFRKGLVDDYSELFEGGSGDTTSAISQFGQKFGWYGSLFGLSQGDITKFENITQMKMHECLYMLTYMKEKNQLESQQIKSKIK